MATLEEPLVPAHVQAVLDELIDSTQQAIKKLWDEYEAGDYQVASASAPESILEIVTGCELLVDRPRDGITDEIYDLEVRNFGAKDRIGNNFMGYAVYNKCVAFRGEIRHVKTFLDFAYALMRDSSAEPVLKRGSEVKFPHEGLMSGLSYDDFAARVEIVELAFYLNEAQHTEDPDADESTVTILSVSKNGQQLLAPPPEDTQYDADVSLESVESAPGHGPTVVNPLEEESAPNYEHSEAHPTEEVIATFESAANIPRIEVHPPSTGRPGTEYLRPTSWSPLTSPDEDEVLPDADLADTVMSNTKEAGAEADTAGDAHLAASSGINDAENASELIEQVVTIRQLEYPQGPLEADCDEDQIMTDGSLFGGTPEHGNEGENIAPPQEPDEISTGVPENPLPDGHNAVNEMTMEYGAPSGINTESRIVSPPSNRSVASTTTPATTSEPVVTDLNPQPAGDSTVAEITDSLEDIPGVDVPVPHGQSNEEYQRAVEALQTTTITDPGESVSVEKGTDEAPVASEAPKMFDLRPEGTVERKNAQSTRIPAFEAQASEALEDTQATQFKASGLPAKAGSDTEAHSNLGRISNAEHHKQQESVPQMLTGEVQNSSPERPMDNQPLLEGPHDPPPASTAQSVGSLKETVSLEEPEKEIVCAAQKVGEGRDPVPLDFEPRPLELESGPQEAPLVGEREKASDSRNPNTACNGIWSSSVSNGIGQIDKQLSGLDVLAKAAESESDLTARKALDPAGDETHKSRKVDSTAIEAMPLDADQLAHGHQHSNPQTVPGTYQTPNGSNAAGKKHPGHESVLISTDSTGEALQQQQRTSGQQTAPNVRRSQVPRTPVPDVIKDVDPSQVQTATDSQPSLISPLALSEDGTDPLALSDGEKDMSTHQPYVSQTSYDADAAFAAQLAAQEARRYPTRKRSNNQDGETPPPAKKQAVQAAPRKKLPMSNSGGLENIAPQTPMAQKTLAQNGTVTLKSSKTKNFKSFREGTRKNPKRSDASVSYKA